jgi:Mg-chelatase subunit ChlD
LPVILKESCDERQVHADVVLVIDISTSMRSTTTDGRSKLEAVQGAARLFLNLMDFEPAGGFDQVALVGFNHQASVHVPLSTDLSALSGGIDGLAARLDAGTRLDLAVEEGMHALDGPAREDDNTAVIILLTDGLPNGVPLGPGGTQEETVLSAANRVRDAGVLMYTIGVGQHNAPDPVDRINADLLRSMATEPEMFYQTLNAAELGQIYSDIAFTLGCPPSAFWGGR